MTIQKMTPVSLAALMAGAVMVPAAYNVRADGGVSADVVKLVGDVSAALAEFKTAQASADKAYKEALAASAAEAKAAIETATKAAEAANKAAANLAELEQRVADKLTAGASVPHATVGDIVINSPEYKAVLASLKPGVAPSSGFKLQVEANTLTGQTGSPPASDNTLVPADRRPGITPGAFRALRIVDFLTSIPTNSNAWEFVRELLFTNNAAEVAEGAAKAESILTFEMASVNIRTIAHFLKASNQILADAPALRAYIDGRLRYGVDAREDLQLITGDGTGQNISGMTTSGNYTAFTPTSGDTALDSLNRAKYAIIGADYAPTAVLMNPADWGAIERLKTQDLAYVVGNPFGTIVPVVWGVPVVVSNNMTATKFLMADFATSYEHIARQSTVVEVGYVNDDFTKNLVTIRAEKRSALATIRPASTRFGSLTL